MHEYVLEKLAAAKGTWPKVAEGSGVPLRTLEKVARREHRSPRYETIEKLFAYLRKQEVSQGASNRSKA